MTPDIDQLASAYIDGETTAAETAWVESNPEAMRYVDEYRKIQSAVKHVDPVEPSTKEQHIGAALAAFDGVDETVEVPLELSRKPSQASPEPPTLSPGYEADSNNGSADGTIVPLHGRGSTKTTGVDTSPTASAMSKRRNRWLAPVASAAAVVALAVTGVSLLASQDGVTEASDEVTADVAAERGLASQPTGTATQGNVNPSSEDLAEESEESAAEESEESSADEESSDDVTPRSGNDTGNSGDDGTTTTPEILTTESESRNFDGVPSDAELESLATQANLSTDLATSPCAQSVVDPEGGDRVGFLPVSVDGVDGELIVFESATNASGVSVLLVTAECVPF